MPEAERGPRDNSRIHQRNAVSLPVVTGLLRAADVSVLLLAAAFAYQVYIGGDIGGPYLIVVLVAALLQINIFQFTKLYEFDALRRPYYQVSRLAVAWSLLFFVLITVAFLTKTSAQFSRGWATIWFFSGLLGLVGVRLLLFLQIQYWVREGQLTRNIVVVGAGEQGRRLLRSVKLLKNADINVLGIFDDRTERTPPLVDGHPNLGTTDDLIRFVRRNRVDQIIVALPWTAEERLLQILKKLRTLPVDIRLCPDLIAFDLPQISLAYLGPVPVMNVFHKPLSDWKFFTKELEDRCLAALILLFILPLLLVIGLIIKIDSPGPVLFRQKRYGFNNQIIEVFKFRTMHVEACRDGTVRQAIRHDSRVTRFGQWLRRASLDELPQFLNVLRGEMSIVGPRPHAVPHDDHFTKIIEEYASRHRMKPGITGWAQVNGWRGQTDTVEKLQKRVEHDLYYIENWSVAFDLKIILMTIVTVFRGVNAY